MLIPTNVFGRQFTHIPDYVRQDLEMLQQEGAIYTDHWIDEVDGFRHVRVEFTSEETRGVCSTLLGI